MGEALWYIGLSEENLTLLGRFDTRDEALAEALSGNWGENGDAFYLALAVTAKAYPPTAEEVVDVWIDGNEENALLDDDTEITRETYASLQAVLDQWFAENVNNLPRAQRLRVISEEWIEGKPE